jgi:hypothetical protein
MKMPRESARCGSGGKALLEETSLFCLPREGVSLHALLTMTIKKE